MHESLAGREAPAVAFFIFNRPDTTRAVFERIAAARPRRLLVVADGPRPERPDEARLCQETRAVLDRVDWDCDVRTNFAERNMGCRGRVSSGLDWVFDSEPEAIILEDDCLPEPSFFPYCADLLARYRDDERVALVSGVTLQPPSRRIAASYFFSRYPHIWGWASWRRAWRSYDVAMSSWPDVRASDALLRITGSERAAASWRSRFDAVHSGELDTWDYQLVYATWMAHRLCITPARNLVTNVGFRPDATHTSGDSALANMATVPMPLPLRHPETVRPDDAADAYTQRTFYDMPSLFGRARSLMTRLVARRAIASSVGRASSAG